MMILNLTQHKATPKQKESGVFDLEGDLLQELIDTLTFDELPTRGDILCRLSALEYIIKATLKVQPFTHVMLGGAPFLMSSVEKMFIKPIGSHIITPVYAFSKRIVTETEVCGKITKASTFEHIGFVEVL